MNKIILKSTFYKTFRWILFLFVAIVIISCEKQKNPTCRIVYPEDYSNFGKGEIIDIEVEANDPNGNNLEIRFYIGEEGVFSTTTFPYEFSWNTDGFEEGEYIIEATAIDAEGRNSSDSHKIYITVSAPKVKTLDVQTVSLTSATVGGEIVSDGGTAITETGIYWGEDEDVEANGEKIRVNSIDNSYNVTISGLATNSTYYYKAYAVNKMGETLGDEKGFLTLGNEIGTFTDNRDGQEYG
ncbi:MAG: Ig-like domain-containing protein, partial [Bacteroidales bacterium]